MSDSSTTTAFEQLLQQLRQTKELGCFELAIYDRQFLLLGISSAQAALCGNPDNPFCNPACHARRATKIAAAESEEAPSLIHCPGALQHCLVPFRNENGERHYLLIGGGRESHVNLSYLEELSTLNRVAALPLLESWSKLPHYKAADLLAAGERAQQLLGTSEAPACDPGIESPALSKSLIEALGQADEALNRASDRQSLSAAVTALLEPVFGPESASLLEAGTDAPRLNCLDRWQPATSQDNTSQGAIDEQLTCLPLQVEEQTLGSLLCCGPSPSESEMQLLQMLAERIAGRLQQLQAVQPVEQPSVFSNEQFEQLLALDNPQDLCRRILQDAVSLVPANKASLMLLNSNGSKLHMLASIGMNQAMAADLCVPADQGVAGQALKSNRPLLVEDLEHDPRISQAPRPRFDSKSLLCLPLTTGDQQHGIICLTDRKDGRPFSESDLDLLTRQLGPRTLLIERLRNRRQLDQLLEQVALDPATGVYSATMFQRRFSEEASRATRLRKNFALLLFSFDQTDEANRQQPLDLASRLQSLVRRMDVIGRIEEQLFAVLLPDTAVESARSIAGRLTGNNSEDDAEERPGISCGIALYPTNGSTFDTLLDSARGALQKAWLQGGSQAVVCDSSARNDKIVFL